jgi:hypothetical protein
MVYFPGVTATTGTSISSLGAIPYSTIIQNKTFSAISLNTSTGIITVASTGFYQVTVGVMVVSSASVVTAVFQLELNSTAGVIQQILEVANSQSGNVMCLLTTIIDITSNPTTLSVVNTTAARTINNQTNTVTGAPASYVTIIGLQ